MKYEIFSAPPSRVEINNLSTTKTAARSPPPWRINGGPLMWSHFFQTLLIPAVTVEDIIVYTRSGTSADRKCLVTSFEYLCYGSTMIINSFALIVGGIDIRRQNLRQILASKVDPRAVRVYRAKL